MVHLIKASRIIILLSVISLQLFVERIPTLAGIIHAITPDQRYIDYGSSFDSVLWGESYDASGTRQTRFSGVLIAPNWVLTSAHVVSEPSLGQNASFRFGTGNNLFSDRGFEQSSTTFFRHPNSSGGLGDGPDLALIYFDSVFPVQPAVLYEGEPLLGYDYSLVGFGVTGTAGTTEPFSTGDIRGGINVMDRVFDRGFLSGYLQATFTGPTSPNYRELGIKGAAGDSGGGWFVQVDGQYQLSASHSGSTRWHDYDSTSNATLIDIPWIRSVTAVPEPTSSLSMIIGISTFAYFRRKKRIRGTFIKCRHVLDRS